MTRRTSVALAGVGLVAGFAGAGLPALADQREVTVTLMGGRVLTVAVPPGTPLDQVRVPGITTPILTINEVVTEAPTPAPSVQPPVAEGQAQKAPGKKRRDMKLKPTGGQDTQTVGTEHRSRRAAVRPARRDRQADGTPTSASPSFALALPGAAPIGVPNFFIEKFRIPPFLLPIYQAAGIEYGVRWEILAAINEIETDYGRNLNVSSAGALGWMQFIPSSWKAYGVDANRDGKKDPYNPVDAIFAAARYLKAAGAQDDIRKAIFAYNHADWYVDSVLMRARLIGGLPADLVGSLTGLTQGRFPVDATARYATSGRRATDIFAGAGSPVVAVQDGRIVKIGRTARLGRFVQLRDVYGNTYTYGRLRTVSARIPVPKVGRAPIARAASGAVAKERLFANPSRAAAYRAGGAVQLAGSGATKRLRVGSTVIAGTILGRIGTQSDGTAPHMVFEVRPAGRGAPRIDPKPILDGWKLLESTAVYRAAGKNPFFGPDAKNPTIGQVMLMSKEALARRVLADPRIEVYDCGRRDIKAGVIDRRALASLAFLSASGLKPTVTSLQCGHSYLTASGNVSEHSTGTAIDIAKINGIPIIGHQGAGSITELTIRRLLTLQGTMKPHQIISLMTFDGADNTFVLPDHADHIHVGWRPLYTQDGKLARQLNSALKPSQWIKLIDRIGQIDNPSVATTPSKYAIPAGKESRDD